VNITRFATSGLLGLGVLFVFAGLTAALGVTVTGVTASLAVIAALIYSGAVWFAPRVSSPPRSLSMPVVFDAEGRIISGAAIGQPLASQFPPSLRGEVDRCCAAALAGAPACFTADGQGRSVAYECLPVRRGDGSIVYGIVVSAEAIAATV
jgi:uncharacterized protein (DUF58 family)